MAAEERTPLRSDGHDWRVTVQRVDGDFWPNFAAGKPLSIRYTSKQGAKLDAWQFVLRNVLSLSAGAILGTRPQATVGHAEADPIRLWNTQ
jgi:hypothetical protein